MSGSVLAVHGLRAGYGDLAVVRSLSLEVAAGEVVGLFGPNGAGKTTTLSTLAGLLPALGGKVSLFGVEQPAQVRAHRRARSGVSLVPEDRGLFRQLTVDDNLRMGNPSWRGRARTDEVLEAFPRLGPLRRRRAGLLSGGEQQMLVLARALLTRPRLLLVDEMSMGLAPTVADDLLRLLRDEARRLEIGVLVVEQHLPLALRYVDRGYVLTHGELVRSGSAAELADDEQLVAATYFGS